MAQPRRNPVFNLEEAREAILDSDSDNEFDKMSVDLGSDEEYSNIKDLDDVNATDLPGPPGGDSEDDAPLGLDELPPDFVPGASGNKRRRIAPTGRSWDDDPAQDPHLFDFTGMPGLNPNLGLSETSTPLDCYLKFVSNETFEKASEETNRYASCVLRENPPSPSSPAKKWCSTTAGELMIFWALCMLMGIVGKPVAQLYWSTRKSIVTPFFLQAMTGDRFQLILRFLHFNNNENNKPRTDPDYDPLFKLRPYYDALCTAFHTVFTPFRSISFDEALIRFYGRLSFKNYNPRNGHLPAKYGMKAYKICDPTGYTWKFVLYTGKMQYSIVELVLSMMAGLLDKGYRFFMDNWYSSPALFTELFKRKTHACGTVRSNRIDMPKDLKPDRKLRPGEAIFCRSKELLTMLWRDKRDVTMLSTIHSNKFSETHKKDRVTGENVQKPEIVLDYNRYMGGVDLSDFLTNTYADMRKSLKWYKKLVFHMNDLGVMDAYIVYCHLQDSQVNHLNLVLDLIEELVAFGNSLSQDRPKPSRAGSNKENVLRLE
ncbi:piggyBac transposable element-derived protein 4-like [Lytechinus variegatus]|uniref:piggyBac transposable element-derived protein 4-like n=1 Tax=Lytechinus variegatus TaxID=7654 RepID=UPI001BB22C52|nr:piggyBac transposable element-derived protein 4-like [Lytechinus variegatus]